jgi:hypothetical protein
MLTKKISWQVSMAICIGLAGIHTIAFAEDAQSILKTAKAKQLARWDGVNIYVVDQTVVGTHTQTFHQRTVIRDSAGNEETVFLPVPKDDVGTGACQGARSLTTGQMEAYAQAAEMIGETSANEIENGLEEAGLPRSLLGASTASPYASFDPRVMMGTSATFARAAGQAEQVKADEAERDIQDAAVNADQIAQFMSSAKLIGTETLDGRSAFHLQAGDIKNVQEMDGQEYSIERIDIWFDAKEYVPLKMQVNGTLTSGKDSRQMIIENVQTDYRAVPDSNMYESYRQLMKITGAMDAAQEAELQEAQAKMAEFEQQMKSMPASQREMMEKMMGPQLEMMRKMASGGGFETEVVVNSISIVPEMTTIEGKPCPESAEALN